MGWKIVIERKAQKALAKIPNPYKTNIIKAIDSLTSNPFDVGSAKLKGSEDLWRIRTGPYRIIYQVKESELVILIVRIGHRGYIYKNL